MMDEIEIDESIFIRRSVEQWAEDMPTPHGRNGELVTDFSPVGVLIADLSEKMVSSSRGKEPLDHPFHGTLAISHTPPAYEPCNRPVDELEDIAISDMRLETHHRGKKTTVRVLTLGYRQNEMVVTAVVEDERGTAVMLQLSHQPDESKVPAREIMRPGNVFVIKEPFFEAETTGAYSLRVDHLGDLVRLSYGFEDRIPAKWRKTPMARSSSEMRNEGNRAVRGARWAEAHRLYTSAIHAAKTTEEEQLALFNRSLVNIHLGRPLEALQDAQRAGEISPPSDKSLFRETRALYELGDFQQCLDRLERIAASRSGEMTDQIEVEIQRVKARIREQQTGEYDLDRMHRQAAKTPPLIDCATYSSAVEVRPSPGRGKGLFTKVAVKAGDLVLCEKAFDYSFIDEYKPDTMAYHISITADGAMKALIGGSARLITRLLQKMHHDPRAHRLFHEQESNVDRAAPSATEVDGHPVTDSFLVTRIVEINAYGAPRTSLQRRTMTVEPKDAMRIRFGSGGIWVLSSRINHSCYINCQRSYIGDMQVIRAARDLPSGTEILVDYRTPAANQTYDQVQERLGSYEFKCGCSVCEMKKATTDAALTDCLALDAELDGMISGDTDQLIDVEAAEKMMEKMEATLPAGPVRLQLLKPLTMLGFIMLAHDQPGETIRFIARALRALDFDVTAMASPTADFEIKRWGYMHEDLPFVLSQMFAAYHRLEARTACQKVKRLAEVAYSIHVGDVRGLVEECPEFGLL